MSNIFGAPKATEESRSVPQGDTVGSYASYLDAQKAVDYLADQQFPVQLVSIVGNDLKMVERVTGRLSYPRVAMSGALSGMWFGLFVGVMLSFFAPAGGAFSIVTSVLMGAAFFMLFGIVTYATQRGKRDFTSTSQVVATNYDVIVAFEASQEARRLLHQLPMSPSEAAAGHAQGPAPQNYNPQNQPFQQPGQAPERPAGWSDPYGQRGPQPGAEAGGPQAAAEAAGAETAGTQPAPERAPAPAAVRYPDLPDGRPQYGVRVDPSGRQPGQAEAAPDAGTNPTDGQSKQ
ncbi:general stress protein [Arthrobacter cavernae]|uniref:ECF transporter S component n=1 Tax=Arthrobacter cavernae TaxID=2817681 RepID=A0A939HE93_9MICC|nr:general stress protein [Arthrobacter cavernae]MBO1266755.1 ECF transporter S component [Arthrobacter cavernae]